MINSILQKIKTVPWWALVILGIVIAGNLASLLAIDVHPDEAYYWTWSVFPDFSYYDHPPMVGWILWIIDHTFGSSKVAIRLPALLAWIVAAVCIYRISFRIYESKISGWLAVAVFSMLPVYQAASHIITPDIPLLLFSALTFYFLMSAILDRSTKYWMLSGVMLGFSLLSKYNAVLTPLIVFIALVTSKDGRKHLSEFSPWLASLIAMVLFLPVVFWNYENNWVSFSMQLGHGIGHKFTMQNLGVYIGGQFGAALFWMLILMMLATFRGEHLSGERKVYQHVLIAGFWTPLLFFGWASGTAIGEVNWPAIAYFPGTVLVSGMLGKILKQNSIAGNQGKNKLIVAMLVISCLISATLVNLFRFPIEAKKIGLGFLPTNTQLSDTFGWNKLKSEIDSFSQDNNIPKNCRVYVTTKYIWASMVYRFHDLERFALMPGDTRNQYANWNSRGFFSKRAPCLVIERFELNNSSYSRTKAWPGIGKWRLEKVFTTPTSDTPRVYGFYLPISSSGKE